VWHRKGTRLHCAVKKACAGKKMFEGGILKPQLRTMIFIFRRKHVFMKTKKMWSQCDNLETPALFSHYCVISSLLCGRPKSNPPDWTDQSEHTIL
jgi:hypothetical protein